MKDEKKDGTLWPMKIFFEPVPPEDTLHFIEMDEELKGKKLPEYNQHRAEVARELWEAGMSTATEEYLDEFAAILGRGVTPEEKATAVKAAKDRSRNALIADMRRRDAEDRGVESFFTEAE